MRKVYSFVVFAFDHCKNLTNITCYAKDIPEVDFSGLDENVILHVPAASLDAYKAASEWSTFKKIVGF